MALPWDSNSEEILSKNKSVYENAVTGILWSCMLLLIGSCSAIFPYPVEIQLTLQFKEVKVFNKSFDKLTKIK